MKPRHALLAAGLAAAGFATAASSPAFAHAGQPSPSFVDGLAHAFGGLDHLLAMVVVGAAAARLRRWWLPVVFVGPLALGSIAGRAGMMVPNIEVLVVASAALLVASLWRDRTTAHLVAVAGVLHGLAHGAEAPTLGGGRYLAGFVTAAALVHSIGALVTLLQVRVVALARRHNAPTAA